ncbi:peptidylprolyl isomerase [Flavobacterium sp.]|uniref:peptidylprolyl isomerase n=1 Tax=Flavobacterium sp. TaxID=239 RepID=UPI003F696032
MKHKIVLGLLLFLQLGYVKAQNTENQVLFTIDETPFYTDEFIRVYNKNLDLVKDNSQKDLDVYFDLFLGYKLKVNKAYKIGLNNSVKYQNELKSYRTQLAKNYTNDSKVTQNLIEEAYERGLVEIKASHILIMVDANASPEDTLIAFNKIKRIKANIDGGKSFEDAAVDFSEDPSAKDNKGNLGYFSVFRMVYDFENQAYKTPKGKVSEPFRTSFGYHIIKVNDIRTSQGEVTASHIMIVNKPGEDEDVAKKTIDDIYQKYKQGETFEALAQQYSDDKSSSSKGGVLQRFGTGQLSSEEFEETAFGLKNPGDVSEPFKSQYGWHIVKLIEKHPVKTFEESKFEIENKIKRDDRSRVITSTLNEKLKAKYPVKTDKVFYDRLKSYIPDEYYKQTWTVSKEQMEGYNRDLLTIDNKAKISGVTFINFVLDQQKVSHSIKPIGTLVDNLYQKFVERELANYYDQNLESEFEEFKFVMNEYREGLLLFDLMEREIWERSKTDTIGQQQFYLENQKNYQWKERMVTDIYSSTSKDDLLKALKYAKNKKSVDFIKEKLNTKENVKIMVQSGTYEQGDKIIPKGIAFEKGISDVVQVGEYYFFANTSKVLPAQAKELSEAKGKVINDYQQALEANWVNELKKEVTIKVNNEVLDAIKKQLKK